MFNLPKWMDKNKWDDKTLRIANTLSYLNDNFKKVENHSFLDVENDPNIKSSFIKMNIENERKKTALKFPVLKQSK